MLENGEARYKDPERLWLAKAFHERNDNLICAPVAIEESLVGKTVMHHFEWGVAMRTTYDEADDILTLHLSDKPIVSERSQDWNSHISYGEDGIIVEVVILEASKQGAWPLLRTDVA